MLLTVRASFHKCPLALNPCEAVFLCGLFPFCTSLLPPPQHPAESHRVLTLRSFLCLIFWFGSHVEVCWLVLCVNWAPAEFLSVYVWQRELIRPLCFSVELLIYVGVSLFPRGYIFLVTFQPSSVLNILVLVFYLGHAFMLFPPQI